MKKSSRIPKKLVYNLLSSKGLKMKRTTIKKSGKRVWLISDGNAFVSLNSVYAFYSQAQRSQKSGVEMLLEKARNGK